MSHSFRKILFIGFAFTSLFLYSEWKESTTEQSEKTYLSSDQTARKEYVVAESRPFHQNFIDVESSVVKASSDVLELSINEYGDIVNAKLLQFPESSNSKAPLEILNQRQETKYISQSGLIGTSQLDIQLSRPKYEFEGKSFVMAGDILTVTMAWKSTNLYVVKDIILKRGEYDITTKFTVTNLSDKDITIQEYGQIIKGGDGEDSGSLFMPTYDGAAYSTDQYIFEKWDNDDFHDSQLDIKTSSGWVAMLQHYFVTAWIPDDNNSWRLYTSMNKDNEKIIGFVGNKERVASWETKTLTSVFYVGPKDTNKLEMLSENLSLTIDYGWLWFISKPLFDSITLIQKYVENWGVAIIILTLLLKVVLYPLTKIQYQSMANVRKVQPKINSIKERFGESQTKIQKEIMALYKREKINPFNGCLTMLLQMPIFLALYYAILESVELRNAPFVFWINDLSSPDPYFVLPLLFGVTMYFLQKVSQSENVDPMQKKIMSFLPVMMTCFFFMFPAALVLYWLASNAITIIQAKRIFYLDRKVVSS